MADVRISILTNGDKDRIKKYLKVLYQFHKLTDKEIELLTEIVYIYIGYFTKYGEEMANRLTLSTESRAIIRKNVGNMDISIFQNYLVSFRKKKVIIDNKLSKYFIPPATDFNLMISFNGSNNKGSSTTT